MKNLFRNIVLQFAKYEYPHHIKQLFYKWLVDEKHAAEKEEALQALWVEAQKQGEVPDLEKSLERWRQNNGISAPQPKKLKQRPLLRFWQSAAALLFIMSASLLYMLTQAEKTETDWLHQFSPVAQITTCLLPDGSEVQMNSKSTLLYPKQFTGKNRSVYLVGEANFKVKPDKKHPFIVKTTNDFRVTALGTEFNVSAYAENQNISTTLISGSVLVEYDNLKKGTILNPEEQLSYNKESRHSAVTNPSMEDVTAWQRGELVFRQMTVEDIITVLERKYNYQFIYSLHSLSKDRFSFRFKDQAPLPEVMDVVVDVVGNLSFKIRDDKCYITSK